ncbi:glycosyl transferase family 2 [Bacteroidia bacterium]|nr:glycosyl transferase family 2 [Bacteroidia bacterium]GHV09061.1 glycosyl transferase family 2 [Bacteroidia bacterium]
MLYYWVVLAKPYRYLQSDAKEQTGFPSEQPPVSVVVCVRKKCHNFNRFLSALLEQDYPEFEVIIVSDGISDSNKEILASFQNEYKNLYTTYIPEDTRNVSRKKLGLTLGIKAAKYDYLLFTEADGYVRTNQWISAMTRHFDGKKSIVLGFSAIVNSPKHFLSRYIAFDYFFSNLQMLASALFKRPYAGDGRSLAYEKRHFTEQKGFVRHRVLKRGEDDLFINDIATRKNTAVELSAESVVFTEFGRFEDWKRMKSDRAITQSYYKRGSLTLQRLEFFSRLVFLICTVACFFVPYSYPFVILPGIAALLYIIRFLSELYVTSVTTAELQLKTFYFLLPVFDLIQIYMNLYFYLYRIFNKKENYTYLYENK